jgi:type IV secretory pathway TraG/TraD family ATPase VirD4
MREGQLNKSKSGCLWVLGVLWASPILIAVLVFPFGILWCAWDEFRQGRIGNGLVFLLIFGAICFGVYKYMNHRQRKQKGKEIKPTPDSVELQTTTGKIQYINPYRGFLGIGAAGSGKTESISVPLLSQFISKNFAGIVYAFKFPEFANEIQVFIKANRSDLRHYFLNFNNPHNSDRVNPIHPRYLPNTSYAREYAQAIVSNLMKESIKKPDFWSRSATDLLTACIWYLKEERPDICDLPHVCAMITSNDTALLSKLQENPTTAQMTISIYNAMQRGAEGQTAGVIGTLQGAIAQINTPELMYIFGSDDFSLDVNNPQAPAVVTVGSYPTLTTTLAPLCSLVITVATKLMNQPGKNKSFVLLDEAPTCYIPNLEVLPNTGRSNKIATVIMCQDLAQLTDGYGKEKADVLFASCNNHFYGRVASSHTSEILSKQFGKTDKSFVTRSRSRKTTQIIGRTSGQSESVQERDIMRPAEFLALQVGEFAGIAVETNRPTFKAQFLRVNRPPFDELKPTSPQRDIYGYYKQVRYDINKLLGQSAEVQQTTGKKGILNDTQTNSKANERGNVFDIFGD